MKEFIPNILTRVLEAAPEQVMIDLVESCSKIGNYELSYAIVELYCRSVERGEYPHQTVQSHISAIIQALENGTYTNQMIGKSSPRGRRDVWLSSMAWLLIGQGNKKADSYRFTVKRWNRDCVGPYQAQTVSSKMVERSVKRYSWLDSCREHIKASGIESLLWPYSDYRGIVMLGHRGVSTVSVPDACVCSVPGQNEWPSNKAEAQVLCRSFCLAVDHFNSLVLPGLHPFFSRVIREAMAGKPVLRMLRIARDRSGRPPLQGASEKWPTDTPQDQRDVRLASMIYRFHEEPRQGNNKISLNQACILAAKEWAKEKPENSVGKDTARTAWKNWNKYVRDKDLEFRIQERIRQEREGFQAALTAVSQVAPRMWMIMIQIAGPLGVITPENFLLVEDEVRHFRSYDREKILSYLVGIEAISVKAHNYGLQISIADYAKRASDLGIGRISDFSITYVTVAADYEFPIYQPSGNA